MKNNLIKVCGLTLPENVDAVCSLGVDFLGFIFYPPSPRYTIGKASAAELIRAAGNVLKTGVFVDHPLNELLKIAHIYQLDVFQLHGNESPETCFALRQSHQVIKAFPVAGVDDFDRVSAYQGACDYFLFDTKGPRHGGNGTPFDWNILDSYTGDTPFLLSGGIRPEDAGKLNKLSHSKLAGFDLNSRFETSPGLKNIDLLNTFLDQLRSPKASI
ncbi:MAG: phosphoribosylanthranilate isomerase [Saprospiraceae bacterium]|nr:phosphoribosylanthranilate isomerase [Saprospiraceae bacterium]